MEQLKAMKECLTAQVQAQMGNLQNVDTKELGEAMDMIKDLSEAIYYCTITKAMEEQGSDEQYAPRNYYTELYYDPARHDDYYYRDMDRGNYGRMYYSSNSGYSSGSNSNGSSSSRGGSSSGGSSSMRNYSEREFPTDWRDSREGRSPMSRKMYMESKEMQNDKLVQMKNLENYMQELSQDVTEMIKDATPEEQKMLHQKLTALASKVEKINA